MIQVLEIARVASPEGVGCGLHDFGSCGCGLGHYSVDFLFGVDVVCQSYVRGGGVTEGEAGVGCQAFARPDGEFEAVLQVEEGHSAVFEFCTDNSPGGETEAVAVECDSGAKVVYGEGDESDVWLHLKNLPHHFALKQTGEQITWSLAGDRYQLRSSRIAYQLYIRPGFAFYPSNGDQMAGKFEVKNTSHGQFMFNLKAGNGEIILTSEFYTAKSSALGGIESVRTNSPVDGRFDRKIATNGSPYFTLKAANGEIIGKSEMYSSTSAMENGIASVMRNAPEAQVVDTTK